VRTEVYIIVRVINNNLDFILFLFYYLLKFLFFFFLTKIKVGHDVTHLTVTVTQSCDIEKIIDVIR